MLKCGLTSRGRTHVWIGDPSFGCFALAIIGSNDIGQGKRGLRGMQFFKVLDIGMVGRDMMFTRALFLFLKPPSSL